MKKKVDLPKCSVKCCAREGLVEAAVGEQEAQELVQVRALLAPEGLAQRCTAEAAPQRTRHAPPRSSQSGRHPQRALSRRLVHLKKRGTMLRERERKKETGETGDGRGERRDVKQNEAKNVMAAKKRKNPQTTPDNHPTSTTACTQSAGIPR